MQYRQRRKNTDFTAMLKTSLGPKKVGIINATGHGVKVELDVGNVKPYMLVDLIINERAYPATVIWAKDGKAGLEFKTPLPPNIATLISRTASRPNASGSARFLMS